jgi:hypothetical protein
LFDVEKNCGVRFNLKLQNLKNEELKEKILYYAEWIYNTPNPLMLTDCVACPQGHYHKIQFDDGWTFDFKMNDDRPFFMLFYRV